MSVPVDALEAVRTFVNKHPEYGLSDQALLEQGKTNSVLLGYLGEVSAVFKYYGEEGNHAGLPAHRKRREVRALDTFARTGLVPEILNRGTPVLLVLSYVKGQTLEQVVSELWTPTPDFDEIQKVSRTVGEALGRMACASSNLESAQLDDEVSIEDFLRTTVDSRKRCLELPSFRDPLFRATLESAELRMPSVLDSPSILSTEDHNPGNCIIKSDGSCAYVDLELWRVGRQALQLGAALDCLCAVPHRLDWLSLLSAYETATDQNLSAKDIDDAQAMAYLNVWLRFADPSTIDNNPEQTAALLRRLRWCNELFQRMAS